MFVHITGLQDAPNVSLAISNGIVSLGSDRKSDRDITLRALGEGRVPQMTVVGEIMTETGVVLG